MAPKVTPIDIRRKKNKINHPGVHSKKKSSSLKSSKNYKKKYHRQGPK